MYKNNKNKIRIGGAFKKQFYKRLGSKCLKDASLNQCKKTFK